MMKCKIFSFIESAILRHSHLRLSPFRQLASFISLLSPFLPLWLVIASHTLTRITRAAAGNRGRRRFRLYPIDREETKIKRIKYIRIKYE